MVCVHYSFDMLQYIIGGRTYSLQDIENGVLCSNRKGVSQKVAKTKHKNLANGCP